MKTYFIFALVTLLWGAAAQASSGTVDLEQLAKHPSWLKLLHTENIGQPSTVHSPAFFLVPEAQGRKPTQELQALVSQMNELPTAPDQHVRCRFPARVKWVESQLGVQAFDISTHCPDYTDWAKKRRIDSISVVMATGYLGNPASYYGHTLLKFNTAGDQSPLRLLDQTLNYGAIGTSGDDPVRYILKGVFGGYSAGFSKVDFYHHVGTYGELELRDMWEYRLNLPQASVDFVVDHAWEVLGQQYTYYFFRENCAFRMTELLEIIDGIEVNPKNLFYTVPQVIISNLDLAQHQGKKLVSEIIYHPSRQTRYYAKYQMLNPAEQAIFKRAILMGLDENDLVGITIESQHKVIDTILDYFRFAMADPGKGLMDPSSPIYRKALALRFTLPPGSANEVYPVSESPHGGRSPSWVQLSSLKEVNGQKNAQKIRLRPAYYDALDAGAGHVRNAGLAMGEMEFLLANGQTKLWRLDLVNIESVNPGISGLPGDDGFAWKLKAGVEQAYADCQQNCLIPRLQSDAGYGKVVHRDLFLAAYVGGGIQDSQYGLGLIFARLSAEAIYRPTPSFSMRLRTEQRWAEGHPAIAHPKSNMEVRFALGKEMDLRVFGEKDKKNMLGAGIGFYW